MHVTYHRDNISLSENCCWNLVILLYVMVKSLTVYGVSTYGSQPSGIVIFSHDILGLVKL